MCCDSHRVHSVTYIYCGIVPVLWGPVCAVCWRAICWGRCSLVGLLVVMSIVVVLVLLFYFSGRWGESGGVACPLVLFFSFSLFFQFSGEYICFQENYSSRSPIIPWKD